MGLRTALGATAAMLLVGCAGFDEASTGGPATTTDTPPDAGDADADADADDGTTDQPGAADGEGDGGATSDTTGGPAVPDPDPDPEGTTTGGTSSGSGSGSDSGPAPPTVDPNGPYGQCDQGSCRAPQSVCQWIQNQPGEVCSPSCTFSNTDCPPVQGYDVECLSGVGCFIQCGAGCPAGMDCNIAGHCVWP